MAELKQHHAWLLSSHTPCAPDWRSGKAVQTRFGRANGDPWPSPIVQCVDGIGETVAAEGGG